MEVNEDGLMKWTTKNEQGKIPYIIEHNITKEKYKFVYEYFLEWFDNIDSKIIKELIEDEIMCKKSLFFENMHLKFIIDQ